MSSKNIGFLESVPRLNPAILGVFGAVSDKAGTASAGGIPWWVYALLVIALVAAIWYLSSMYWILESPANVRTQLRMFVDKFNKYADQRSTRKGIRQYLADLKKTGVPDSHLALTNFHVCSATSAGVFTPLKDGIASPEAVRLAINAGARYLDITIHSLGKRNKYAPIVCEMEAGSNWKRTTMNQVSFRSIMQAVQQYALAIPGAAVDINESPFREDPLFIMLRFSGKPRTETFDEVAKVLRDTIEPARLDFTWYGGRAADRFFKTPITEFIGKVVLLSNKYPPITSKLSEYINIGPRSSIPLELAPTAILNIPDQSKPQTIASIQQNLTICREPLEEPAGNTNGFEWSTAHALGIHFVPMNFWSEDEKLASYRAPAVFGVNSFLIKPLALRHVIVYIAPPADPNPRLNAGDGTPAAPAGINTSL